MIRLIVAIDRRRGLAKCGIMPWYIPEDEQYFTDQTKTHGGHVLTGSKTFQTYKGPLADRENFVLTRQQVPISGVTLVHELEPFLNSYREKDLWVAGGTAVFEEVMVLDRADELYITHIDADFGCDQFFPDFLAAFTLSSQSERREQNGFYFTYAVYAKNS